MVVLAVGDFRLLFFSLRCCKCFSSLPSFRSNPLAEASAEKRPRLRTRRAYTRILLVQRLSDRSILVLLAETRFDGHHPSRQFIDKCGPLLVNGIRSKGLRDVRREIR